MLAAFAALMRKDIRIFLGDRRAVLMSVVAPIAIASFFGYLFGGGAGNENNSKIPVLVSNQDASPFARDIVSRLETDKALDVKPASPEQARDLVRQGKATAAFLIPQNFGVNVARAFMMGGDRPRIGMLYDPSHGLEMRMLEGMMLGASMEAAAKQSGRSSTRMPFEVNTEAITAGPRVRYNGYAHSFGGMGIQFQLMVGVDIGVAMLILRERGVWKRMRAAPLSKLVLLGSRAASSGVISMGVLLILYLFARVVFDVRILGSFAGFLCICAAFSLMTAAFGLLVASLGKTPEATRGLAILASLFLVMLGGAWVPTFIFPEWLRKLTVVIPTRWAMDGLDAVTWRGLGFSDVAKDIWLLVASAVVFGAFAVMRFRWEAD